MTDPMRVVSTRLATLADAEEAVGVLRQSITSLCELDHQHEPATLDQWLRNKTPQHFAVWLADPESRLLVAEVEHVIAGVAALHQSGEVRLCYVRPTLTKSGVGAALVEALESQARAWGIVTLKLRSTLTARGFYERIGYLPSGDAVTYFGLVRGYPYSKVLGPGSSTSEPPQRVDGLDTGHEGQ